MRYTYIPRAVHEQRPGKRKSSCTSTLFKVMEFSSTVQRPCFSRCVSRFRVRCVQVSAFLSRLAGQQCCIKVARTLSDKFQAPTSSSAIQGDEKRKDPESARSNRS